MKESEDILVKIGDALSQVMATEDEMVTKWVCLVEVIDTDGERGLWTLAPEGAKPWDTLGLLTHAIHREQAATIKREGDN